MKTKLSLLKEYMAQGDFINALRLAAKFGSLGEHKKSITTGWAAYVNPSFYTQIGKEPLELINAGIEAIRHRYQLD